MIILTIDLIEQLKTPKGGINQETMELIGSWPLTEGWKDRLIGARVSDKIWKAAMKARAHERHVFRGNTRSRRR